MQCVCHGIAIASKQGVLRKMEIWNAIFEWGVIAIAVVAVVFALLAVLSLVFDGLLARLSSWLRKEQRR